MLALAVACRPGPTIDALDVPPLTLTAIALRNQAGPTVTARPSSTPLKPIASATPAPLSLATITPSPIGPATATPGPAQVPAGAPLPYMRAGLTFSLLELDMVDPLNGWALATNQADPADHVVRTTDGGITWTEVTPPQPVLAATGADQRAWLAASSADEAWVTYAGRTGQPLSETWIWRTTDGGQSWRPSVSIAVEDTDTFAPISLGTNTTISWFTLNLSADAANRIYRLYVSEDGDLWRAISNPISAWSLEEGGEAGCQIADLEFVSLGVGYATGECPPGVASAALSRDGGITWARLELPDLNLIYGSATESRMCAAGSIVFASNNRVVAPIRCQVDGGTVPQSALVTWIEERSVNPIALPGVLVGVTFFDDARGLLLIAENVNAEGNVFRPYTLYQTSDGAQTLDRLRTVMWRGPLQSIADNWVFGLVRSDTSPNRTLVVSNNGGTSWDLPDAGLVVGP